MTQDAGRIQTQPTVQEGGTIQFRTRGNVDEIRMLVPGVGAVQLRVIRGRAEYTLPPQVRGGSVIIVSDNKVPDPTGSSILVVGGG